MKPMQNILEESPKSSPNGLQPDRLQIVIEIIKRSRRVLQQSPLKANELAETADAWNEILRSIPTLRLDDSYIEAMSERSKTTVLQAVEITEAWRKLRANERAVAAPRFQPESAFAPEPNCRYCDDTGWQPVDQPERGPYRYSVRACACDCASPSERNKEPLQEPWWEKLPSGRWQRTVR